MGFRVGFLVGRTGDFVGFFEGPWLAGGLELHVGVAMGVLEGGTAESAAVGVTVGVAEGELLGTAVGDSVGTAVGVAVGESVGTAVGVAVGESVGTAEGG